MKLKILFFSLTLLLLPTLVKADSFIDALTVDIGYGHAFPLGGTQNGNLRNVEFVSMNIFLEKHLVEIDNFYFIGGIGSSQYDFNNPEGYGIIPSLEVKITYPISYIMPFLITRVGSGYVNVDNKWKGQDDGFIFLLRPSVGFRVMNIFEIYYSLNHLSNAGLQKHNDGINSNEFSFSLEFPLD